MFNWLKRETVRSKLEQKLYEASREHIDCETSAKRMQALADMYAERVKWVKEALALLDAAETPPTGFAVTTPVDTVPLSTRLGGVMPRMRSVKVKAV